MSDEPDVFLTTHALRWDDEAVEPLPAVRVPRSRDDLDGLVVTIVADAPACRFCTVGRVTGQAPDGTGADWRISKIEGHGCLECFESIRGPVETLQRCYTLAT